jgi:large subunit ribosomal protein L23
MSTDLKAKYAGTLIRPRITEKANLLMTENIHTFEVAPLATKNQVSEAVKAYYKVTPIKVRMVRNPNKKVFIRGKKGIKAGVKKAYVYLKKGDKME